VALIPNGTVRRLSDKRTPPEKKRDEKQVQSLQDLLQKANLPSGVAQSCGVVGAAVPLDAIFLPVFVKLAFDLFVDARIRSVEELKAKAEPRAYGATIFVEGKDLHEKKCLFIARTRENNAAPNFLALLQIESRGEQAFTLLPVYVKAATAVAVASKESPQMIAAFAVAIKAVGSTQAKDAAGASLPTLILVGQGSTSIAGIEIGDQAKPHCVDVDKPCARTDLIARPPANSKNVTVSVAVAEVGKTGIDTDAAIAQLKAVKEAIGPALSERIKVGYSD
jgi:hypothetical protein